MDFKFVDTEIEELEKIKNSWMDLAISAYEDEGAVIASDIEKTFNYNIDHVKREKDYHVYSVMGADRSTVAIVEISHVLPNSDKPWVKMLDIHPSPKHVMESEESDDVYRELIQIMAYVIVQSITLIFKELESKEVKMYCRTETMRAICRNFIFDKEFNDTLSDLNLKSKMARNWLIITKTKG